MDSRFRVFLITFDLSPEQPVPKRENDREILVPMMALDRMMNAVGLWRDKNIAQETHIRFDIGMVKTAVPGGEQIKGRDLRRFVCKNHQLKRVAFKTAKIPAWNMVKNTSFENL